MTEPTREQQLHQIISELFQIIDKATLHMDLWPQVDALKARYQALTAEPATYKTPIPICTECGTPMNDDGKCPVCDDVPVDIPPDGWSDALGMRGY